jgi:hypothetical protein
MTYLLVVYLFLANGDVKIERYPHIASTMSECLTAAVIKRKEIWEQNNRDGSTSSLCILEDK